MGLDSVEVCAVLQHTVTDLGSQQKEAPNAPVPAFGTVWCHQCQVALPSQLLPDLVNVLHLLLLEESHSWSFIDAQGQCN